MDRGVASLGGLPKHDPAVMLEMLVLLWTPVAMFTLSGYPGPR